MRPTCMSDWMTEVFERAERDLAALPSWAQPVIVVQPEPVDDRPNVMDLRDEPAPCEVCGEDASEYPCEMGTFCEAHHADLGISGCRSDDCWGADFGDRDDEV